MEKPSGCVAWLVFDPDTLALGPFFWYGGEPGERLPDISSLPVATHTKGNALGVKAARPNVRVVTLSKFKKLNSIAELVEQLFGTFSQQQPPTTGCNGP